MLGLLFMLHVLKDVIHHTESVIHQRTRIFHISYLIFKKKNFFYNIQKAKGIIQVYYALALSSISSVTSDYTELRLGLINSQ